MQPKNTTLEEYSKEIILVLLDAAGLGKEKGGLTTGETQRLLNKILKINSLREAKVREEASIKAMDGMNELIEKEHKAGYEKGLLIGREEERGRIEKGIRSMIAWNQMCRAQVDSPIRKVWHEANIVRLDEILNKTVLPHNEEKLSKENPKKLDNNSVIKAGLVK